MINYNCSPGIFCVLCTEILSEVNSFTFCTVVFPRFLQVRLLESCYHRVGWKTIISRTVTEAILP